MTRAQLKQFNRLAKKSHRNDLQVVEQGDRSCVIWVPWPSLYLTYDFEGILIETQTDSQRKASGKALAGAGGCLRIEGELGSLDYTPRPQKDVDLDDDVPF